MSPQPEDKLGIRASGTCRCCDVCVEGSRDGDVADKRARSEMLRHARVLGQKGGDDPAATLPSTACFLTVSHVPPYREKVTALCAGSKSRPAVPEGTCEHSPAGSRRCGPVRRRGRLRSMAALVGFDHFGPWRPWWV